MRFFRPHGTSAFAAALAGACVLCLLATGTASAGVLSHRVDDGGTVAFWTPERMARAVPLDAARVADVPAPAAAARKPLPHYVSEPVAEPRSKPFRAAGKVYFQLGRRIYVCSATIVKAPSRSLVWTAAHCLRDLGPTGRFAKRWAFVPAYDRGDDPYGVWPAKALFVPGVWARGNQNYDFGAAILKRRKRGSVQRAVGASLPIDFNPRSKQGWTVVGFPEARKWGQNMWMCESPLYRRDRSRFSGPAPIGIGCDMNAGASGGPWITATGSLGAVSSYIYRRGPKGLYGTYLGNKAKRLYAKVRNRR